MKKIVLAFTVFMIAFSAFSQNSNSELERMRKELDEISTKLNRKQTPAPQKQQPVKKSTPKQTTSPTQTRQTESPNRKLDDLKHTLDSISATLKTAAPEKNVKAKTPAPATKPVSPKRVIETEEEQELAMAPDAKNDLRFTIGGGYVYRLGNRVESGLQWVDDLEDDARNGFQVEVEAQKYFWNHWGFGLNAYYAREHASAKNVTPEIDLAEETNTFIYVGPSIATRFGNNKLMGYLSTGIGPVFFNSNSIAAGSGDLNSPTLKKTGIGWHSSLSGEYRINPKLGIGLKLSITNAAADVSDMNITGVKRLSLSNFLIGGFISFNN